MKSLVISLFAEDKPGIVDALAKVVKQHQGNWLSSRFAHMAGQFAGFVEVNIAQDQAEPLLEALNALPGLTVHTADPVTAQQPPMTTAYFSIMGNDKSGIVSEITSILQQFNVNILEFDSSCNSAPNWGSEMFTAQCKVAIPDGLDIDDVQQALESIANDLMVDISFKKTS
ncbi:glycine cleavage system protein R [Alteromonas oceanisediminis]|uniref:glycine cleavage system protein R n=1 Tax=Alteromonas oceanisediminis TaxID=2836180 RepID=UPI001BDB1932|nr:ACT domain-containing protein [Alteromonas oceanisediminis]MBT0585148.1 glycine cleavage system protein R [Alteromonas oceanisediminis]